MASTRSHRFMVVSMGRAFLWFSLIHISQLYQVIFQLNNEYLTVSIFSFSKEMGVSCDLFVQAPVLYEWLYLAFIVLTALLPHWVSIGK